MAVRVLTGDCRDIMRAMEAESVDCIVTSPPYWGLRDYGTASWQGGDLTCQHMKSATGPSQNKGNNGRNGAPFRGICRCGAVRVDRQLGMEASLGEHIATMVDVFEAARRVLKKSGTLWLNYGDCYAAAVNGRAAADTKALGNDDRTFRDKPFSTIGGVLKPKDLCMVPARLAIALQEAGWWLRSEIVWHKPNPMPESIRDRPTSAHEKIYLLAKSERYFYDAEAIAEEAVYVGDERHLQPDNTQAAREKKQDGHGRRYAGFNERYFGTRLKTGNPQAESRNKRNVWTVPSSPFSDAHFATFPPALIEPCILAGCPAKVCAECGKPWVRQTTYGKVVSTGGSDKGMRAQNLDKVSPRGDANAANSYNTGNFVQREKITTGFRPSCHCKADTVPGVVLDCFGGAGTTGLVADRLGRNAILIELNPTYAAMAMNRVADDLPLFAQVTPS